MKGVRQMCHRAALVAERVVRSSPSPASPTVFGVPRRRVTAAPRCRVTWWPRRQHGWSTRSPVLLAARPPTWATSASDGGDRKVLGVPSAARLPVAAVESRAGRRRRKR